jgi:hypothetical protein
VHDFLIWKRTDEQPVGHIAVVCEVGDHHVCIAEQNVDNNKMWGGGHYSRKFMLERNEENGAWTIRDDEVFALLPLTHALFGFHSQQDPMFGWVRCMKDQVVPTPPFAKPAAPRLPVDGKFEGATATALQIFAGLDAKRGKRVLCVWVLLFIPLGNFVCPLLQLSLNLFFTFPQTSPTRILRPPFSK